MKVTFRILRRHIRESLKLECPYCPAELAYLERGVRAQVGSLYTYFKERHGLLVAPCLNPPELTDWIRAHDNTLPVSKRRDLKGLTFEVDLPEGVVPHA